MHTDSQSIKSNQPYLYVDYLVSTISSKQDCVVDFNEVQQDLYQFEYQQFYPNVKTIKGRALLQIRQQRKEDKTVLFSKMLELNFDTKLRHFRIKSTAPSISTCLYVHSAEVMIEENPKFQTGPIFGSGKIVLIYRIKSTKGGKQKKTDPLKVKMQRPGPDCYPIGFVMGCDSIPNTLQFSVGLSESFPDHIVASEETQMGTSWNMKWND